RDGRHDQQVHQVGHDGRSRSGEPALHGWGLLPRPAAERCEQLVTRGGRDRLLAQRAREANRRPHLVEIVDARVALAEMALEGSSLAGWERVVEVLGDELDELPATHLSRFHSALFVTAVFGS